MNPLAHAHLALSEPDLKRIHNRTLFTEVAPDLDLALNEVHRLLRSGAQAAFLDFSAGQHPLLRKLHYALHWFWGALWGLILHGNPQVYAYIAKSLAHFPHRKVLHNQFSNHQFMILKTRRFMFGMIEVIICQKK